MQISQIFISDNDSSDNLSDYLKNNIKLVKSFYPNHRHVLYTNTSMRSFIGEHFDEEVLWAFDYLNPYAYKADLGRYCILYILGGVYIDVGIRLNGPLMLGDQDYVFFRDLKLFANSKNTFAVCNGLVYSKPNNVIFKNCISQIIENCKNHFYGTSPLSPTGPVLFGRKIAEQEPSLNCHIGDYVALTENKHHQNFAFVGDEGSIIAFAKGLTLFNNLSANTNSYGQMWSNRLVYGSVKDRIAHLYKLHLGRDVDDAGLLHYSTYSDLKLVEAEILRSQEYLNKKVLDN